MPYSEQIEAFGTEFLCRNSVSVEEIQDSEFPYGQCPDSEQIEVIGTKFLYRSSVSVEEIKDGSVSLMFS